MAKLLIDKEWFEQIAPGSLYESEYERIVLQQASMLYPDYYGVPFKKSVYSDEDVAKPDIVLVNKVYRDWWVVEVEMENHSLESHIIPQVLTLTNATYGEPEADYIFEKMPDLDPVLLKDMVKGTPPRVLVIVNTQKPEWVQPLERYNVNLATFEVFRSDKNRDVYRINGYQITAPEESVSNCHFDPLIPNCLVIESPAALGIPKNGMAKISYESGTSEWKRIDSGEMVWLIPRSANPLPKNVRYELFRVASGSFSIKAKVSRKRGKRR